jgi:hypothetical protein
MRVGALLTDWQDDDMVVQVFLDSVDRENSFRVLLTKTVDKPGSIEALKTVGIING